MLLNFLGKVLADVRLTDRLGNIFWFVYLKQDMQILAILKNPATKHRLLKQLCSGQIMSDAQLRYFAAHHKLVFMYPIRQKVKPQVMKLLTK